MSRDNELGCCPAAGDGQPSQSLADIDRAMRRIRRSQTRRSLSRLAARTADCSADHWLVAVVDAVEEGPQGSGEEVTVGLVAERMGIDPSRASRLVSGAIESGHLVRMASQRDGRRIGLELTDTGRQTIAAAHRFRQAMFAMAMRDWTEQERTEFARLLTRFSDAFIDAAGC